MKSAWNAATAITIKSDFRKSGIISNEEDFFGSDSETKNVCKRQQFSVQYLSVAKMLHHVQLLSETLYSHEYKLI